MLTRIVLAFLIAVLMGTVASAQMTRSPAGSEQAGNSGKFRDQDTLPGSYRFYRQLPAEGGFWGWGPGQQAPSKSSFKVDAHDTVDNYSERTPCVDCHRDMMKDLHGLRMGITCVQCHTAKPVAGVYQYYSPNNPIRRHAYVCAKCHEDATPSFASYVIHEPNPLLMETRHDFPLFFYSVWFMLILAGGVFAVFIPYVSLWAIRELIAKLKGEEHHG